MSLFDNWSGREALDNYTATWVFAVVWGLIAAIATGAFLFFYIGCMYVGTGRITKIQKGQFTSYIEVECQTKKGEPFQGYVERPARRGRSSVESINKLYEGQTKEILYPGEAKYQELTKVRFKADRSRNFWLVLFVDGIEAVAVLFGLWTKYKRQ